MFKKLGTSLQINPLFYVDIPIFWELWRVIIFLIKLILRIVRIAQTMFFLVHHEYSELMKTGTMNLNAFYLLTETLGTGNYIKEQTKVECIKTTHTTFLFVYFLFISLKANAKVLRTAVSYEKCIRKTNIIKERWFKTCHRQWDVLAQKLC